VCLGALTITSQRTELLVGSYGIKRSTLVGHPGAAPPHQPHGYGNQAAQQGFNPAFYNAPSHAHGHRARIGQKNIVGSKVVHPKGLPNHKPQHVPLSHFIGDQMKNSARKVKHQQLMVGSFAIDTKVKHQQPHGQFGIGNQAAPNWSHGTQDNGSNFYNHISRKAKKTQKLLVGSTFVDSSKKDHPVSRGYGNEGAQMTGRDGTGNPNFYNAPSHKATKTSKLLVGSTFVDTSKKVGGASVHSRGFGNEGAQMTGRDGTGNPNFYNAPSHKATKTSKLLVGSYNVDMQHKASPHPFIGNQAAPQNHMDVGTNIVFRGVHSEGGIKGVKKHEQKKGLVGSYGVDTHPATGKAKPHQPHGFGDQSASRGNNPNFYNGISH